jgi:hypothetical protein
MKKEKNLRKRPHFSWLMLTIFSIHLALRPFLDRVRM